MLFRSTNLEPDILESEVKWALGSITRNKASHPCRPLTLLEYEKREAHMWGLALLSCSESAARTRNQASPHSFTGPWNPLKPSAGTGLVP